jgi:Insertion element 4 transposase N-terminal/Transposase DDE domain
MSSITPSTASVPAVTEDRIAALLGRLIPLSVVREIADRFTRPGQRRRKLPLERTMLLVIAMNLKTECGLETVAEHLWVALGWATGAGAVVPPTKGAISQARQRTGIKPMVELFRRVCRPIGTPQTPGVFYAGLRVLALDSTREDVPDSPENVAYFGRRRLSKTLAAFPNALCIYLLECGTRALLDAICWPSGANPNAAGLRLLRAAGPGTLLLWDAGFHGLELVRACNRRDIAFLGRISIQVRYPVWKLLPDGSYLAHVAGLTPAQCPATQEPELLRVLPYTVTDPTRTGYREPHRLITSLLDHRVHPARRLILLYHERWEIELAIDEMDTHQRIPRGPLRSQTPGGILQEFYGLWLAYYALRVAICEAALRAGLDPDQLSFTHAHRLLVVLLPVFGLLPSQAHQDAWDAFMRALSLRPLPAREDRTNPRLVKKPNSKFERKPPGTPCAPLHQKPFHDAILMLSADLDGLI